MVPRPTTPTAYMHRWTDHSGAINPCRILLVPHASPTPTRIQPVCHKVHVKCRQVGPMLLHTCKENAFAWSHVQQPPGLTCTGSRTTPVGCTHAESYKRHMLPHHPPHVYSRCGTKAMQSAAKWGQCCFIHATRRHSHGPTSNNPHCLHAPGDGPLRWDAPMQNPTRDTCCPTPTRLQPVRHQGHAKCHQGGAMLLHTCKEKANAWPHVQQPPRLTCTGSWTTPVGCTHA